MQISFDLLPATISEIYSQTGENVKIKSIVQIHKSTTKSGETEFQIRFSREVHKWIFTNNKWTCVVNLIEANHS